MAHYGFHTVALLALGLLACTPAKSDELVVAIREASGEIALLRSPNGQTWTSTSTRVVAAGSRVETLVAPQLSRSGTLLRLLWVDNDGNVRIATGPNATHLVAANTPINPPSVRFGADPVDVVHRTALVLGDQEVLALRDGSIVDVATGQVRNRVLTGTMRGASIAFGQAKYLIAAVNASSAGDDTVKLFQSADGTQWTPVAFTFVMPQNAFGAQADLTFSEGRWMLLVQISNRSGDLRTRTCRIFESTDGLTWPRISPLPDPGCGAYNQGAAIRVNGRAWIFLGTMQQRPPNVSVNFGPFVDLPASVKPVGYFSLAAGAVPPPPPPPPVPPTATCTSMVFAHRSAISADVILAGTTPGLSYTVTANGRTAAFTDPHLANSCQPDLQVRTCSGIADASGTVRCTLTSLMPAMVYDARSIGSCRGELRTLDEQFFGLACPSGGGQQCATAFRSEITPCLPLSAVSIRYSVTDNHCSAIRPSFEFGGSVARAQDFLAPLGVLSNQRLNDTAAASFQGPFRMGISQPLAVRAEGRAEPNSCNIGLLEFWGGSVSVDAR